MKNKTQDDWMEKLAKTYKFPKVNDNNKSILTEAQLNKILKNGNK